MRLATIVSTLNDLQKLLGTVNWLLPLLGITTHELLPLFSLLKGNPELTSPRWLTKESQSSLQMVMDNINNTFAHQIHPQLPVHLSVIYHSFQPYALLSQWDDNAQTERTALHILEWFLSHSFTKTVTTALEMMARLFSQGRLKCQQLTGRDPIFIHLPFTCDEFHAVLGNNSIFQITLADYNNIILHSLPHHRLLGSLYCLPLQPRSLLSPIPLQNVCTVFIDGSGKTGKAAVVWR